MSVSPLRYFLVVGLHPRHNIAVLACVTAVGVWTVAMSAGEVDSAVGMLLFVQMFLASTGFLPRARRGHFDPILTSSPERLPVVMSHWCASILPGVFGWAIVTGADWFYGGAVASAADGRRLTALLIVSVVAWTAGFALVRGAAGALWTAALVAVLLHRSDLLGSQDATGAVSSVAVVLRHAVAVILCPFLLLGTRAPLARGSVVAAGCATACVLLSVWKTSGRFDFYLRDRT